MMDLTGELIRQQNDEAMAAADVPQHHQMLWPTLQAAAELGGSASIGEIVETVIKREASRLRTTARSDGWFFLLCCSIAVIFGKRKLCPARSATLARTPPPTSATAGTLNETPGLPELDIASVRRWREQRVPKHIRNQVRVDATSGPSS